MTNANVLQQARDILALVDEYGCMACHGTARLISMPWSIPLDVSGPIVEKIEREKEEAAKQMADFLSKNGVDPSSIKMQDGVSILQSYRNRWHWGCCCGVEEFIEQLQKILQTTAIPSSSDQHSR